MVTLVAAALLTGFVAAMVLAAGAGLRRTDTAFERLQTATRYPDVSALVSPGVDAAALTSMENLPEVAASWPSYAAVGQVGRRAVTFAAVLSGPRPPGGRFRPVVQQGRMYRDDRADEVVVLENLSRGQGIHVGDELEFHGLSPEQFDGWGDVAFGGPGAAAAAGPTAHLRVVGVVRDPSSLTVQGFGVFGSPAFYRRYAGRIGGGTNLFTWVRDEPGALANFLSDQRAIAAGAAPSGGRFAPVSATTVGALRAQVDDAVGVLDTGLVVFLLIAMVAGVVAIAQQWGRYAARSADDQQTLSTLGMTQPQRVLSLALPIGATSVVGAVLGVAGAIALSPLFPMGVARRAEPNPGVDVNVALLAVTALIFVVLATVISTAVAARTARRLESRASAPLHPSRVAQMVGASGAPLPIAMGTRMALEPGRGRTALPVRSTLVVTTIAVAGVVAAAVFGHSLDRLSSSPPRYGWPASIAVLTFDNTKAPLIAQSVANPRFDAVGLVQVGEIRIGSTSTDGYALDVRKGHMQFTMLDGRMPATPDEIALGPALLDRLHATTGGTVRVTGRDDTKQAMRVVGTVLVPEDLADHPYSESVALSPRGFDRASRSVSQPAVLIRYTRGADATQLTAALSRADETVTPGAPAPVANLSQLGNLPELLAAFLGVLGLVALTHALLATTRRRRHEFGVLRTLGFVDRQLSMTVAGTALTAAAVALVAGIPIGLAIGNGVWAAVAGGVDVARDASLPWLAIPFIAAVTLGVAVIVAGAVSPRIRHVNAAELQRVE
jgi:hypothetical protein